MRKGDGFEIHFPRKVDTLCLMGQRVIVTFLGLQQDRELHNTLSP